MTTLLDQSSHFDFGKNWQDYAAKIDKTKLELATQGMAALIDPKFLAGKTFLDIGCGSGIHALAALRLGAAEVTAIDLDPNSVAATRGVLDAFAPAANWKVFEMSVFDTKTLGTFDVVYSWGVLHHTGNVKLAMQRAVECTAPGGILCMAIYLKTALCGFWKAEKRFYVNAGPQTQAALRRAFVRWQIAVNFAQYGAAGKLYKPSALRETQRRRGMDFENDLHDWLGGYPYESMTPKDVRKTMTALRMREVKANIKVPWSLGLHGSACNEYVFRHA